MPEIYVIGGANGSGKTTIAMQILPNFLNTFEYVNADEIAAGISPFNPESVAIQAGRLMLERLAKLSQSKIIYDNTSPAPQLIAEKTLNSSATIYHPDTWNQINEVRND